MNNIESSQVLTRELVRSSEFADGLSSIDRMVPATLTLPVQVSLVSADVPDKPQLEALYPMTSLSDYPINTLRPTGLDPDIFFAACFRDTLAGATQQLQLMALQRRSDARKFGRLARLLSEQDALFRLAQMYASALVQG